MLICRHSLITKTLRRISSLCPMTWFLKFVSSVLLWFTQTLYRIFLPHTHPSHLRLFCNIRLVLSAKEKKSEIKSTSMQTYLSSVSEKCAIYLHHICFVRDGAQDDHFLLYPINGIWWKYKILFGFHSHVPHILTDLIILIHGLNTMWAKRALKMEVWPPTSSIWV